MSESFAGNGTPTDNTPSQAPEAPPVNAERQTNALPSQVPPTEKVDAPKPGAEKKEPSKSPAEAIKRASEAARAKAETAPKKPDAGDDKGREPASAKKPEAVAAPERTRGTDGKFAGAEKPAGERQDGQGEGVRPGRSDDNSPHREAPARFSGEAKAAWASAPDAVRAEAHRAIRELEGGYEKHKADADAWRGVKEYDDLSKRNGGGGIGDVLGRLNAVDQAFSRGPIEGLQQVADHFGINLRAVAAHIMGQSPDQVQQGQDSTIAELRRELAGIKSQMGGVQQTFARQHQERVVSDVNKFAAENPRFDELAEAVAQEINHGYSLQEAYDRAERLNPAPNRAPAASQAPRPPLNPAGQKSIAGAPSSGSDPGEKRAPSASTIEALRKASARVGART